MDILRRDEWSTDVIFRLGNFKHPTSNHILCGTVILNPFLIIPNLATHTISFSLFLCCLHAGQPIFHEVKLVNREPQWLTLCMVLVFHINAKYLVCSAARRQDHFDFSLFNILILPFRKSLVQHEKRSQASKISSSF